MRGNELGTAGRSPPRSRRLAALQCTEYRGWPGRLPQLIGMRPAPPRGRSTPRLQVDQDRAQRRGNMNRQGRLADTTLPLDHRDDCHLHRVHHVFQWRPWFL